MIGFSVVAVALVMVVVSMVTGSVSNFNSGLVLAKAKDDNNSGSSSGSSTKEATPSDGNPSGTINNPQHPGKEDSKDISDIPEENGGHCLTNECPKPDKPTNPNQPGQCMIPEGCPSHNLPPIVIKITKVIHENHNSGGGSGSSHSLSKACFDAIKIAWFGKVHRGQNHEVDKFIDNCLT